MWAKLPQSQIKSINHSLFYCTTENLGCVRKKPSEKVQTDPNRSEPVRTCLCLLYTASNQYYLHQRSHYLLERTWICDRWIWHSKISVKSSRLVVIFFFSLISRFRRWLLWTRWRYKMIWNFAALPDDCTVDSFGCIGNCNVFSVVQSYWVTYPVVPLFIYGTSVGTPRALKTVLASCFENRVSNARVFVASPKALLFSVTVHHSLQQPSLEPSLQLFLKSLPVIQTVFPRKPWMFD